MFLSLSLRPALVALFVVSMPLLAAQQTAIPPVRLREDAPALTPEQAKALSPMALGEALLAAGHAPVSEATIGPEGMEPPPPPGMPVFTRVKLYLQAAPSEEHGFCERVVATIYLKPVNRLPDGHLPAASPARISTEMAYRWVGTGRDALACAASKYKFFTPAEDGWQALAVVRLLASASRDAKCGLPLPFTVSVEDREGPSFLALERQHPEQSRIPGLKIITDAKAALAALPIDSVSFVRPAAMTYPDILLPSDLVDDKGRELKAFTIFLGGDWTVGLVINDGRIVRIRLLREIPPPF